MSADSVRLAAWIRERYVAIATEKHGNFPSRRALIDQLASNKEGFSGDEIEKMINELSFPLQLSSVST